MVHKWKKDQVRKDNYDKDFQENFPELLETDLYINLLQLFNILWTQRKLVAL